MGGCEDYFAFVGEKCGSGEYSGTESCRPPKTALVVHGYGLTKDGGLGANELVLKKALELCQSRKYEYVFLPAGVNEDTGERKPIIGQLQAEYLFSHKFIPYVVSWKRIASDTATEVKVTLDMMRHFDVAFVDVIGFFPHSWKVYRCWQILKPGALLRLHHVYGIVNVKYWLQNLISFGVGLFDPLGKRWPAKEVKKRRRDLYTPAHLKSKVIF